MTKREEKKIKLLKIIHFILIFDFLKKPVVEISTQKSDLTISFKNKDTNSKDL